MKNRKKIKNLFAGIDEMPLPKTEKMLPPEALVNKDTPVITKRKPFPMLAAASLAIVALTVVTVPFIGSVLNPVGEETDNNSLLKDESVFGESHESQVNSTVSDYSEAPIIDMPIVSCGKYTSYGANSYVGGKPGEVVLTTMHGGVDDINELKDGVLYAVDFIAYFLESPEYQEGLERIRKEAKEKHPLGLTLEDTLEMYAEEHEFYESTKKNEYTKMYEYLESLDIEFYDKTVYIRSSLTNKIDSEEVYRIAFLTKEQIQSLKGGENYALKIRIVFDELAKMDNEPVYLNEWYSLA